MFTYGHPLILQGAGRIKTDCLNESRINTVLSRYEEWSKKAGTYGDLQYIVKENEKNRAQIAFPLAGCAIGVLCSFAFVHPNSKYIGKFFTLLTTYLGFHVYNRYEEAYHHSRRFGNFWRYPTEIRRMIDNNDSRYAYKWLKDDYLNSQVPAKVQVIAENTEESKVEVQTSER